MLTFGPEKQKKRVGKKYFSSKRPTYVKAFNFLKLPYPFLGHLILRAEEIQQARPDQQF